VGLGIVEFVMDTEEAFDLSIPDEDAEKIRTPRELIHYLLVRLQPRNDYYCPSQRAFYQLRRATSAALATPRARIRPSVPWGALLPYSRKKAWNRIIAASGLSTKVPRRNATVGDTANILAQSIPGRFTPPPGGWTRERVAEIVKGLAIKVFDLTSYSEDDRFVDME
jgi:hypothetical protein